MSKHREPVAPHDYLGTGANPNCRTTANVWTERERFQAVIDQLPPNPDHILDVGCVRHDRTRRAYGNLHAQLHLAYPDAEVIGIDFDENEVEKMDAPGYDIRTMNAEELAFEQSFDGIIAGELIEHLPNPGRFLQRSANHLAHDGKIVVTTPNPSAFRFFRKAYRGQWTSEDHTCWMSPQHLKTLLERSAPGLERESITYIEPPAGMSKWLYRAGMERIGATIYIATIRWSE